MANPANIIDSTIISKYGLVYTLTGSSVSYLNASSNYGYHIYNLTCHNYSSSSTTVTVYTVTGSSSSFYLANAMTIPAKSSLILASKENPLNLTYNGGSATIQGINAQAGATNSINMHLHYDYFYDAT
tara:strand:+ start:20758 stop:21141 length:384 start_codon:yes stop_codon:yes gene_type:complete